MERDAHLKFSVIFKIVEFVCGETGASSAGHAIPSDGIQGVRMGSCEPVLGSPG